MKNYLEFLAEAGGAEAGALELVKTDLPKAKEYAIKIFQNFGLNLDEQIPRFSENYMLAKKTASKGWTKRKDMPVISSEDVADLKTRLENGLIDVKTPFTDKKNPFPQGLTGEQAKKWLKQGLPNYDRGPKRDDAVSVRIQKIPVKLLKPIQQQIYFDKSIGMIAKFGAEGSKKFNISEENIYITSSDNYIIDGHHRYLSGILLDPEMLVNCLVISLPIDKLLKMTRSYGDAIGNKRNA